MISIQCPHCNIKLKVDERKLPSGITSFKCPSCKQGIPVTLLSKGQVKNSEPETQLIQSVKTHTGKLTVLPDPNTSEQVYPLYEGIILVGRKSGESKAAIAIHTSDRSMSREHIRIEVKKDPKGGYKHYLSDNKSKNHTLYNNNYLDEGEVVVLNNNDEIIIGRTILRFNE